MTNTPPGEIIDFQSDALEIRNQKLPLAVRLCVWLPVLLVVLAITWACLAQMDVVVQGQGKLVTNVSTIVMKPLERSVIQKVNVKIGDVVKKDQILITFDPAFNTAEAERLRHVHFVMGYPVPYQHFMVSGGKGSSRNFNSELRIAPCRFQITGGYLFAVDKNFDRRINASQINLETFLDIFF